MAKYGGQTSTFKIDVSAGGALTDISAYIVKVSGLTGSQGLVDVTTLTSLGRKWFPDQLENADISLDLIWDDTATTGPDVIFGGMRTDAVTRSFEYSPDGGTIKYTGECWMKPNGYQISSPVGDVVKATVQLTVDGIVSRAP